MRTRMVLLSTVLLTGGLASPALAAPPVPLEPQPQATVSACGSDITLTEEVSRAREHKNGRVTGAVKVRVTNQNNGKSVLVNASGPGTVVVTELENEVVQVDVRFTGPSLISPMPGEKPFFKEAGLPDLFVTKGPFALTILINGKGDVVDVLIKVPNRIENLCTALV